MSTVRGLEVVKATYRMHMAAERLKNHPVAIDHEPLHVYLI